MFHIDFEKIIVHYIQYNFNCRLESIFKVPYLMVKIELSTLIDFIRLSVTKDFQKGREIRSVKFQS